MKKTLIVIGLVAVLLLAMSGIAMAHTPHEGPPHTQYPPDGSLPWGDADLRATFSADQEVPHGDYVANSSLCQKCHIAAPGENVVARQWIGTGAAPTWPAEEYVAGTTVLPTTTRVEVSNSFRGLRARYAQDACDYCHIGKSPFASSHNAEFTVGTTGAYKQSGDMDVEKDPKSGHRVGSSDIPSGSAVTPARATPMAQAPGGSIVQTRQMETYGSGGQPSGPPAAGNLVCMFCHSVHGNNLMEDGTDPNGKTTINQFSEPEGQFLRKDPGHDGVAQTVPLSSQIRWYTEFCKDCHKVAHKGGSTYYDQTVGHATNNVPYDKISYSIGGTVGGAGGGADTLAANEETTADGYVADAATWNVYNDGPTCRQCHSARAYRGTSAWTYRPRYPHNAISSDQLLRDAPQADFGSVSGLGSRWMAGMIPSGVGVNYGDFPGLYATPDGSGAYKVQDTNALCNDCHNTASLP